MKGVNGIMELEACHHITISDDIKFIDKEASEVLTRNFLETFIPKEPNLINILETTHSQLLSHIPTEWIT